MRRLLFAAAALSLPAADFGAQVHPILNTRCGSCHGSAAPQGGLDLQTYAGVRRVVTPGNPDGSLLIQRVAGIKPPRMPLGGAPLPDSEIAVLREWIRDGAPAPSGGSVSKWQPSLNLAAPALPESSEPHPIDKFAFAYFRERKQPTPPEVSAAAFVRRAYFDLWGLPPSPADVRAFKDKGNDELVARLLGDNARYAADWITFWNDLLRNDEGVVYHGDRKSITPWLKKALEDNLPYDQFVRALLNPEPKTGPEGFLTGVNWRGDVSASQIPVMQAAQNSAQVFLGVNLKCNSCHDSFISRWKLKDAYGLAAFFSDQPLKIHRCDIPTGEIAQAKFPYPELGGVDPQSPLAVRRAAAAKLFTQPENGRTRRTVVNRIWKQLMGRGLVDPPDDMDAEPWSPALLDWLASDFAAHGHDLKHLIRTIMTSRTYRLATDREPPAVPYVFRGPAPRRLSAEQFNDAISAITGEWRMLVPRTAGPAQYARDWQIKSSPLGRALGRPIRDQVVTTRLTAPTTLSSLELVNGSTLASLLRRGAQRLAGELPAAPPGLFDSGTMGNQKIAVDVDVAGVKKLWLVLEDVDSYDAARVQAGWAAAKFTGPKGEVALADLLKQRPVQWQFRGDKEPLPFVAVKTPTTLSVNISGKGFTRFQGFVGVNQACLASDINPRLRFFVFPDEPDFARLYAAGSDPPVPVPQPVKNRKALVRRLFEESFGRQASAEELRVAFEIARSTAGLEDLLWSLFLSPEFQYLP